MVVRWRVGVVLGVGWLAQHSHIVIQGQDHVLRHHRVQETEDKIFMILMIEEKTETHQ